MDQGQRTGLSSWRWLDLGREEDATVAGPSPASPSIGFGPICHELAHKLVDGRGGGAGGGARCWGWRGRRRTAFERGCGLAGLWVLLSKTWKLALASVLTSTPISRKTALPDGFLLTVVIKFIRLKCAHATTFHERLMAHAISVILPYIALW